MSQQGRDENIAAISAEFHTAKTYPAFYEANCDRLGGFTGIYAVTIEMADVLTRREESDPHFYDSVDWTELVEDFVAHVHRGEGISRALDLALGVVSPDPEPEPGPMQGPADREVQLFPMRWDEDGGSTFSDGGPVDFYDVTVTDRQPGGEIDVIEEHEEIESYATARAIFDRLVEAHAGASASDHTED